LLTDSEILAHNVIREIGLTVESRQVDDQRRRITFESIHRNGRIILVSDLHEAARVSNEFAPEHLEVQTVNPDAVFSEITSAGSVFLGDYSPVAAGDYYSGTNHILPTAGACRYASGVGVQTFFKRITYQKLTREGLALSQEPITLMSKAEGLFAEHGYSVLTRFQ